MTGRRIIGRIAASALKMNLSKHSNFVSRSDWTLCGCGVASILKADRTNVQWRLFADALKSNEVAQRIEIK
jgi:hypothetical protein